MRRAPRPRHTLLARIDGGCEDCSAWTDLVSHGDGVFTLEIRHDDTCPAFARMQTHARRR